MTPKRARSYRKAYIASGDRVDVVIREPEDRAAWARLCASGIGPRHEIVGMALRLLDRVRRGDAGEVSE